MTVAPSPDSASRDSASPDGASLDSVWTDSHCHLQDLDDRAAVLARASSAGVSRLVCIGTGLQSSRDALDIAREAAQGSEGATRSDRPGRPEVWATVGLHPHDARDGLDGVVSFLDEALVGKERRGAPGTIVAIGECGLDYHYDHSPRDVQREVFAAQVALARLHDLTLVIHTREAWDDTFAVLASEGVPERTILHCFTGGPSEARRCLDLGAYLSFSGIVTFKNAEDVRDAATLCPIDRLLVETDAPYLAPVPHRGAPNEPALVTLVGAGVARAKRLEATEVAVATAANAARAFALDAGSP